MLDFHWSERLRETTDPDLHAPVETEHRGPTGQHPQRRLLDHQSITNNSVALGIRSKLATEELPNAEDQE